jgi:hypothetical protein
VFSCVGVLVLAVSCCLCVCCAAFVCLTSLRAQPFLSLARARARSGALCDGAMCVQCVCNVLVAWASPQRVRLCSSALDRRPRGKSAAEAWARTAKNWMSAALPAPPRSTLNAGVGADRGGWGRRGDAHAILRAALQSLHSLHE